MNAGQHGRDVQIREEDEIVKDERDQNYTYAAAVQSAEEDHNNSGHYVCADNACILLQYSES
jgi:hypothetical protein